MSPIVTLTTDFGLGAYVAQIKGVILGYRPDVQLVDMSHQIAPQSIVEATVLLSDTVPSFPKGTIHLVVVDPGVGSDRAILYAEIGHWRFVLPDNGLLTLIAERHGVRRLIRLTDPVYRAKVVSPTFHGRDIMAHAIGHLLQGTEPTLMGEPAADFVRLPIPIAEITSKNLVTGEVLFVDHFGNAISNVTRRLLEQAFGEDNVKHASAEMEGCSVIPSWCGNYAQHAPDEPVVLFDSQNRLEFAVVNGNFAARYGIAKGRPVTVRHSGRSGKVP